MEGLQSAVRAHCSNALEGEVAWHSLHGHDDGSNFCAEYVTLTVIAKLLAALNHNACILMISKNTLLAVCTALTCSLKEMHTPLATQFF